MGSAKRIEALPGFVRQTMLDLPPVLHHWFADAFRNPSAWFEARLAFARSNALMSMIGFA